MKVIRQFIRLLRARLGGSIAGEPEHPVQFVDSPGMASRVVEFVGGPLDGYRESLRDDVDGGLLMFLRVPITNAILQGRPATFQAKVTSLAVYKLSIREDRSLRYRFHAAVPPVVNISEG